MPVSFSEWTLSGSRTCFYIKVRPLTSGVVHNFHKNQGILSSNLWVKSYPLKRVSSESFNLNNFFFLKSTFCHSLLGKYFIKKKIILSLPKVNCEWSNKIIVKCKSTDFHFFYIYEYNLGTKGHKLSLAPTLLTAGV